MENIKSGAGLIHFYQKVIDNTVVGRYTTDFILRIFGIFYKKNHGVINDIDSNKLIMSIQANLFEKINKYLKSFNLTAESIIEINFEEAHSIPVVNILEPDKPTDYLLDVFFKKISWDEINEFRVYLVRILQYYLTNSISEKIPEARIKMLVSNTSYVVQELLQNANSYSTKGTDYRLIFRFSNGNFVVEVENYTDEAHANELIGIIDEIKSNDDKKTLILKYMLAEQKHLGIITSIYNFGVIDYSVRYSKGMVKIKFVIAVNNPNEVKAS